MGCGGIWVNALGTEATARAGYLSARHVRHTYLVITRFRPQAGQDRKQPSIEFSILQSSHIYATQTTIMTDQNISIESDSDAGSEKRDYPGTLPLLLYQYR
jgi:hypothetical protein